MDIRQWLEGLMQISERDPETLRNELLLTVEQAASIQSLSLDPWTEPLLTFDPKNLEIVE
jgi:hypothetical protein